MALIKNNAKIGSLISVELCRIRKRKEKRKLVVSGIHSMPMLVVASEARRDKGYGFLAVLVIYTFVGYQFYLILAIGHK